MVVHKRPSLYQSFNCAIRGIFDAVKEERNIRIHLLCAIVAILLGVAFDLTRVEFIILFFTITLVIALELVNTAIERTIDMYTTDFHPLARLAKDIAAGAVFIAAINALVVGWLLFGERVINFSRSSLRSSLAINPADMTFIGIALSFSLVLLLKGLSGAKSPLKGGWPSGHAALAFAIATVICAESKSFLLSALGLILAFLVAQSRVEGDIHNILEVVSGSLLGILVMALVIYIKNQWLI